MASYFLSESGRLLEVAKQAALEAVGGYTNVNAYTIGVAVQAAIRVLQAGESAAIEPEGPPPAVGRRLAVEVSSVEVTPRLRALESVVEAAYATHPRHDRQMPCVLCSALLELEDLDAAG